MVCCEYARDKSRRKKANDCCWQADVQQQRVSANIMAGNIILRVTQLGPAWNCLSMSCEAAAFPTARRHAPAFVYQNKNILYVRLVSRLLICRRTLTQLVLRSSSPVYRHQGRVDVDTEIMLFFILSKHRKCWMWKNSKTLLIRQQVLACLQHFYNSDQRTHRI